MLVAFLTICQGFCFERLVNFVGGGADPGYHAADTGLRAPTQLTLRPCNRTDTQQLWAGHYASAYESGGYANTPGMTPKLTAFGYCVTTPQ